jgi:hypothetical protein
LSAGENLLIGNHHTIKIKGLFKSSGNWWDVFHTGVVSKHKLSENMAHHTA